MSEVINSILSGEISIITGVIYLVLALIISAIGGAIGGVIVGGKHLGNELAAMMGSFYGPISAIPGVLLALIILAFL